MKVRTRAAGLSAGEASMIASDGPSREELSYTDLKTGAMQQEQSISGAPAKPPVSWGRSRPLLKMRPNPSGGTKVRTPAAIKMPNTRAGQIAAK